MTVSLWDRWSIACTISAILGKCECSYLSAFTLMLESFPTLIAHGKANHLYPLFTLKPCQLPNIARPRTATAQEHSPTPNFNLYRMRAEDS
jgi:hypothetical protein